MGDRQAAADACYEEVGRSVAGLVVDCGLPEASAWKMLQGIKIYNKWMLPFWIERYKQESPELPSIKEKRVKLVNKMEFLKKSEAGKARKSN